MKREIAKGAAWMILMRVCDRVLGLFSTLALARLLVPADFGLVAMGMSFIALIELTGAFSFEVALIQRANPTREHYDTAWTLNLGFALLCAGLTAALSPLAARFYGEPRLTLVMLVLAAGWAMQGFENIGIVNFRRRMDFAREFRFMFGKRLAGFCVTLTLAFAYQSYWALIAGQLAGRTTGVVLSYTMEAHRPRLSLAARRDLFSFSSWLLVTNIMGFGLGRLPHFIIGRVIGSEGLGLYTMAAEFARLPSSELSAPINRAVLPGLARLNTDLAAMRRLFNEVMGVTIALALPASVGLALVSGLLVQVVLGPLWANAGPLLAILAISGAVEVAYANSGIAFLSLGMTRLVAALSAVKLAVLIVVALVAVPKFGVAGMALADLAGTISVVSVSTYSIRRAMQIPWREQAATIWRALAATTVMGMCLYWLVGSPLELPDASEPGLLLAASIGLGAVVYVASLFALWVLAGRPEGAEAVVLHKARALFTRRLQPN